MTLTLLSPMKGWATPLADLPDAAFAEKMVGDGVAIDPTGTMLHAPCTGVVVGVHRVRHAVTLRADNGAEILCHIGIETVGLGGSGFTAHVANGDRVEAGKPLIEFDLETLSRGAKSLASPILVVNTDAFCVTRRASETRLAVGDWLMDLEPVLATSTIDASIIATHAVTRKLVIPPGQGIHARPASAIVACIRGFAAEVEFISDRGRASATNMVALMTLGIVEDKPVRYLSMPQEENPALGLRGVRMSLRYPEMLSVQLRAILRATPVGTCSILVPMVASVDEMMEVRQLVDEAAAAIGRIDTISIGVMIETPAAAMTADLLAKAADFFAIGTNDLAQYTLAMDHGNPLVAAQVDALHPAVLRMIEHTTRAAAVHGRPVGVCGGLASDLAAAPILIGLGVTELSAVPGVIPELKAFIRTLTQSHCVNLTQKALSQSSAAAVRALVSGKKA